MVEAAYEDDALPIPGGDRRRGQLLCIGDPVGKAGGNEAVKQLSLLRRNGEDSVRRLVDVQLRGELLGVALIEEPPVPTWTGLAEDAPGLADELEVDRIDEYACLRRHVAYRCRVQL